MKGNPMDRKETARGLFREGFSCSQAVLAAFAEGQGISRESALRISQGFGGGIARTAGLCGAVSGGIMAIGLRHGRIRADDDAARETTYIRVRELLRRFEARHGSLDCRDLLGCDIGTPEGQKRSDEGRYHDSLCPLLLDSVVEILEDGLF
jgi:C_GCAxxG_C_C family probable redox protein